MILPPPFDWEAVPSPDHGRPGTYIDVGRGPVPLAVTRMAEV